MAKTSLSGAKYVERGYGQVEPNHLSAQRTGQIYAQLPAASTFEKLENGQFAKYDMSKGLVNLEGKGEWLMVFNEVKLYEDRQQYEDFAMLKDNYNARVYSPVAQGDKANKVVLDYSKETSGYQMKQYDLTFGKEMPEGTTMVPRMIKINVGDIYTTNCVNETELAVDDVLHVNKNDGYLAKAGGTEDANLDKDGGSFLVVKVYTLADYQKAVKLQRIA